MASLKKWLDRRRNPWKGVFYDALKQFRKDKAVRFLATYPDLPAGSVVLDIGGFKGEWTDTVLASQPDCTVYIFEPHPTFAENLRQKFAADDRVHVQDYALGAAEGTLNLSDEGDASSSVADHQRSFSARIVPVQQFFDDHLSDQRIALAKINIEGGEYDLLPALIDADLIGRIDRLQVQFHLFEPSLIDARDRIIAQLGETHKAAWSYAFVWEEWHAKR
ncbi:FkbM family methyltransferase [Phaeobacter sp. QD34_3]|uniref:FkbM family methyltransferase n=1 Tax=unclassified Phaeobacter TaxID=2621772 RepID=UPI00237F0F33|nr:MULTISPECIES: FkbM family methyltransferase [unclassified Phaeobacter]MDE4131671.1 FkbM family methyltransferase [Phaeobacter sp. QD34_3]MDE4135240.1 FkbM family methyltransferase [Phaeobacter sp. QD34_24]